MTAAESISAYAITVLFELADGAFPDFHRLVLENAARSVQLEPGCLRFDVLTPTGDAALTSVFLYEVYADAAAFDRHLASDHFKHFDAASRGLVRARTVLSYSVKQNFKP